MKLAAILKAAGVGLIVLLAFPLLNLIISRWTRYPGVLSIVRWCGFNMVVFFLIGWLYGSFARRAEPAVIGTVESAFGGSIAAFLAGAIISVIDVVYTYLSQTLHLTPSEYDFLLHGSGSLFVPLLVLLVLLRIGLVIAGALLGAAGGAAFAAHVRK